MNKKGFTLMELLAVIALLGILAVFVTPKVYSYLTEGKAKALLLQEKNVKDAAKLYLEDYCKNPINYNFNCPIIKTLNTNTSTMVYSGILTVKELIEEDYIDNVTFSGTSCSEKSYIIYSTNNSIDAYLCCGYDEINQTCSSNTDNWSLSNYNSAVGAK